MTPLGNWEAYVKVGAFPALRGFIRTGAPEFVFYALEWHKTPQGWLFWYRLVCRDMATPGEFAEAKAFCEALLEAMEAHDEQVYAALAAAMEEEDGA